MDADAARAAGLDPLTLRSIALDSGAGANLLEVAPLPGRFSYSAFDTYDRCPLRYAFRYVYRMPTSRPGGAGADLRVDGPRGVRGLHEGAARAAGPRRGAADARGPRARVPRPLGADGLRRPGGRGELPAPRRTPCSTTSGTASSRSIGEAIHEELPFELTLDPADGSPPVVIHGEIDRIDRLPSGRVEVIDYKTGKVSSQKGVDESLQLSIYALACRDALGPRHARAGDAVLHGVVDPAEHDPDRRAARPGPGRGPGAGGADAGRGVRGDAGQGLRVVRLSGDVPGAGVMLPIGGAGHGGA